jgi:hypothetical protein
VVDHVRMHDLGQSGLVDAGKISSSVRRAAALMASMLWDMNRSFLAVWAQLENERLNGLGRFAGLLADRGVLRPGLSVEEARDLLWTLNSLAVHDLLVLQRGWPPARYRDWLAAAVARELLPG